MASTNPTFDAAYAPSGFFALRTPLLPLSELLALSEGLESARATAAGDDGVEAAERDRARTVIALQDRLRSDPVVREAMFVASPSLDAGIEAWLRHALDARAKGVAENVLRYFARMSARATPFGLFAGCDVGATGGSTHLELGSALRHRRRTRLDMHYLTALCEGLDADRALRRGLRCTPNTTLHSGPRHHRYTATRTDPETRTRTHHLVSVERTDYLDAVLGRARPGARIGELIGVLIDRDPELSREEAEDYVHELIDAQLLGTELAPPVTGDEPLDGVIAVLGGSPAARVLERARDELAALDARGPGVPAARYRDVAAGLEELPARPELARLFQVDLYKAATRAELGPRVLSEVSRAIELLAQVGTCGADVLAGFREAFVARYGDREVPLSEALDEESGIGFAGDGNESTDPAPLLDGLDFPSRKAGPSFPMGAREQHLLRRLHDVVSTPGAIEWSLTDEDLAALAPARPPALPLAAQVMFTLAARSAEDIDRGDFTLRLNGISGPSGAGMLGRFCSGDPRLSALVEQHLRTEEAARPDAIFAEIVHLPEGRVGNVLTRPRLRPHEIVMLARGSAAPSSTIALDDLRISVHQDRVVLRSASRGREVIPRMTTAHAYSRSALGPYRLLCALQQQGVDVPAFSWGALEAAPFLPRVTRGRIVLAPARWRLSKAELRAITWGSIGERLRLTRATRKARHVPRWVGLAEGDHVLPVDLEHPLHLDSFAQAVKGRDRVDLVELPDVGSLVAVGPEGRFVHEIILPVERRARPAPMVEPSTPSPIDAAPAGRRSFAPGSEWLYAKLYAGTAGCDAVLRDVVAPLVAWGRREGILTGWFFLRFGDPGWHLRVRLQGDRKRLVSELLPALHDAAAPLLDDGRMSRLALDTYEREVERYGGPRGVELAERIFEADSDAVASVLGIGPGPDERALLVLGGAHRLLVDLGLDLGRRLAVTRQMREGLGVEHHEDAGLTRGLGFKFRGQRDELAAALIDSEGTFAGRSARVAAVAVELRAAELPVETIASSLVHMHVNRMLRAQHRAQELVVYDFLARLYDGERARRRA